MMELASERLPEISEADALTDLVCDMIYDVVLSDTFIDDPNGFGNHSFASKTVLRKRLEMRVGAEVATALQDINEQAEHFRRRVMPDLKEAWPEFVRVEVDLNERIEKASCFAVATASLWYLMVSHCCRSPTRQPLLHTNSLCSDRQLLCGVPGNFASGAASP